MARLLKITGYTLALLLVAAFAFTRITGLMVIDAGGKALGYSKHTHEWLLGEYPTFAARRDGPYVLDAPGSGDDARRIALNLEPRPGTEAVAVRTPVTTQVAVVVDDPAATRFRVPLRDDHPRAPVRWPMPDRLLAVSDLEGNFAAATALLRAQGVIDADLHWSFGKGHLVLLGDMVDRGDNVVPLLWLLYRLDAEAQAAGGALHYLLGNHEQYLLQGRPKSAHRKYYGTARVAGVDYGELWSERSELGRWLRSKPMLVRVGDTLFVHGGISPQVLATGLDLADIDALATRHRRACRLHARRPCAAYRRAPRQRYQRGHPVRRWRAVAGGCRRHAHAAGGDGQPARLESVDAARSGAPFASAAYAGCANRYSRNATALLCTSSRAP